MYIELICKLQPCENVAEVSEILIALLAELGFESFEETDGAVKAWIPKNDLDETALSGFIDQHADMIASADVRNVAQENWNVRWESNFNQIEIAGRVAVHAPFHTDVPDLEYRICIMPQMSFGTGHHETTALMVELMLDMDMTGKRVLDMGCGTGILAIFAAIRKAGHVTAIDTDEWAYRNAAENCARNGVSGIDILHGESSLLAGGRFDIVLANINRNILLEDMSAYVKCLSADGILQISGFYASDLADMTAEANRNGLKMNRCLQKNNWVAAAYSCDGGLPSL